MATQHRMDTLEARVAVLERRIGELDDDRGRLASHSDAYRPHTAPKPPVTPTQPQLARPKMAKRPEPATTRRAEPMAAAARRPKPITAPAKPADTAARLEELLGGRVLAWIGAVAVLVGIFLLLVIAVSRGWIGETERTVMAGLTSLGLLLAGIRLHEKRGRTEASLAAAATGIAGLFGSLAVAGAVYDLVPGVLALAGALAVGAAATALALRWQAPGIGALGIVGTLLAPALVGAQPSTEGVALLAVATASATAVLLHQRWNWLAFAAFAITAPQWLLWLAVDEAATGFAALLGGLIANLPNLRRGALALLLATVAKVFLYDLASLTEIYRVASFIVLGLLLLGGAFAWQRVRPQPIPDLRVTPEALR